MFRLVNAKLSHVQTLKLAGNALDLAIVPAADSSPPRVVVGIDEVNASTSQLVVFQLNQETWESSSDPRYQQTDVSSLEISRAELNKILYTVEHLRKSDQPYGDGEGGDTVAPDSEAPSTPAE